MGVELLTVPDFPIDPVGSQQAMQRIVDALRELQQQYADNFTLNRRQVTPPWVSRKLIRITDYSAGFGANWFTGRIQIPAPGADGVLDPSVALDLSTLFTDASPTADDCFLYDAASSVQTRTAQVDGSQYAWGTFTDYSEAQPADSSTGQAAIERLPIFETNLPGPDQWCVLTGSSTQYATYTGHLFTLGLGTSFNPSTLRAVAQGDVGIAASATIYLVNSREIGKSTHDLASSSFLPLLFRGTFIDNYNTTPVFIFDGLQWEDCS